MSRSAAFALAALLFAACDTVRPDEAGTLVVEAYVESGAPLPPVRISRTRALDDTTPAPVAEGRVTLTLDGTMVSYLPSQEPGVWIPEPEHTGTVAPEGAAFALTVEAGSDRATGSGVVPRALGRTRIDTTLTQRPVPAVLLDSLSLPLDSLDLEIPNRTGFVYPIVATLSWEAPDPEAWIALRLEPRESVSTELLEYFLRPSAVARESDLVDPYTGWGTWSGVYAVRVEDESSPVPAHDLVVTLVRGNATWASFAASSGDPPRRDPVSNVEGGVGIVAGVSVIRQTVLVQ